MNVFCKLNTSLNNDLNLKTKNTVQQILSPPKIPANHKKIPFDIKVQIRKSKCCNIGPGNVYLPFLMQQLFCRRLEEKQNRQKEAIKLSPGNRYLTRDNHNNQNKYFLFIQQTIYL